MSVLSEASPLTARPASIEKLTASLVDYAGLFPPAGLDMNDAVARYWEARHGAGRWMLGSFVVPLARCEAFEEAVESHSSRDAWSASVILSRDAIDETDALRALRDRWQGRIEIGSVEIAPLRSSAHIAPVANALPRDLAAFYEVQLNDDRDAYLGAIADCGAFAKVRTGGMKVSAFPDVISVAAFLEKAESLGVPFKATAGLHHLTRGPQRISSEPGSPSVWMHGYLNLAVAAALLHAGKARGSELVEVLSESRSEAFSITAKALSWRDRTLALPEIERCRRAFFQSFGSCSFSEPFDELEQLIAASKAPSPKAGAASSAARGSISSADAALPSQSERQAQQTM